MQFGRTIFQRLGFTLLRDNRDSLLFTRSGNRTSIDTEFAGLGGDVNYFKIDFRTAQFIPTADLWNQSLSIIGRLGMIIPSKDDEKAPFYDRFYLGGPETLRGYDYRDIGPRSTDGLNSLMKKLLGDIPMDYFLQNIYFKFQMVLA